MVLKRGNFIFFKLKENFMNARNIVESIETLSSQTGRLQKDLVQAVSDTACWILEQAIAAGIRETFSLGSGFEARLERVDGGGGWFYPFIFKLRDKDLNDLGLVYWEQNETVTSPRLISPPIALAFAQNAVAIIDGFKTYLAEHQGQYASAMEVISEARK